MGSRGGRVQACWASAEARCKQRQPAAHGVPGSGGSWQCCMQQGSAEHAKRQPRCRHLVAEHKLCAGARCGRLAGWRVQRFLASDAAPAEHRGWGAGAASGGSALTIQQDVGGLQVAVQDAPAVQVQHGRGQVTPEPQHCWAGRVGRAGGASQPPYHDGPAAAWAGRPASICPAAPACKQALHSACNTTNKPCLDAARPGRQGTSLPAARMAPPGSAASMLPNSRLAPSTPFSTRGTACPGCRTHPTPLAGGRPIAAAPAGRPPHSTPG